MPIHPGWNVLRFVRADEAKGTRIDGKLFDAYKFHAVNLATEEVVFTYLVPVGARPHQIIKDLQYLNFTKQWTDVELVEKQRFFVIRRMKELKEDQNEFNIKAQRRNGGFQ